MKSWSITKYDPQNRLPDGSWSSYEWEDASQIGDFINGGIFTKEEYLKVEGAYIKSILWFVKKLKIPFLKIRGKEILYERKSSKVEKSDIVTDDSLLINIEKIRNGTKIYFEELDKVLKLILRNYIWGILFYHSFEVHFGYDYYMYVVYDENEFILDDDEVIKQISEIGLFPEKFISPYLYRDED